MAKKYLLPLQAQRGQQPMFWNKAKNQQMKLRKKPKRMKNNSSKTKSDVSFTNLISLIQRNRVYFPESPTKSDLKRTTSWKAKKRDPTASA